MPRWPAVKACTASGMLAASSTMPMKTEVPTEATAGTMIAPIPASRASTPATMSRPRERLRSSRESFTPRA